MTPPPLLPCPPLSPRGTSQHQALQGSPAVPPLFALAQGSLRYQGHASCAGPGLWEGSWSLVCEDGCLLASQT